MIKTIPGLNKSAYFYLGRDAEYLETYELPEGGEFVSFNPDFTVDLVQDELG